MNELMALLEAQIRAQRELRGIKSGIQDLISDGVSPLLGECIDRGFITLKINHDKVFGTMGINPKSSKYDVSSTQIGDIIEGRLV